MVDHNTDTHSSDEPTTEKPTGEREATPDQRQEILWWKCPLCGKQSLNTAAPNNMGAKGALQSHVRASKGGGHGPCGSYPEDFDPTALDEYISAENPTK